MVCMSSWVGMLVVHISFVESSDTVFFIFPCLLKLSRECLLMLSRF